jgi:serine/threonine protein kinase
LSTEFCVGPYDGADRIHLGPAVASGTEGVLYRGFLDRDGERLEVAVKMLQPGHLERLSEWTARWREQVELLGRAKVPGLVGVLGGFVGPLPHPPGLADPSTASLYLVMDWVEGVSLNRWAHTLESPQPEQLLLVLVPVAAALDLLHSGAATGGVAVLHRDVKPANILIRPGGDTVLVDVGSVRGLDDAIRRSGVAGTPGYVAPEVRSDGRWGPEADRYSLGAVAFYLLTGDEPPVEATTGELHERLLAAPILDGRPELADHVMAMLDPIREKRPSSLANWVAQLRRSSIVALSGDVDLPPRAPGRHPVRSRRTAGRPARDRWQRSRNWRIVVFALLVGAGVTLLLIPAGRPTVRLSQLFGDDFSVEGGWYTWDNPVGSASYAAGEYRMTVKEGHQELISDSLFRGPIYGTPLTSLSDVSIRATIRLPSGTGLAGLSCRKDVAASRYYVGLISVDGTSRIIKYDHGQFQLLRQERAPLVRGDQDNQVRLDCLGTPGKTTIALFLGNRRLISVTDSKAIALGSVGLVATSGDAPSSQAVFDDFVVFARPR